MPQFGRGCVQAAIVASMLVAATTSHGQGRVDCKLFNDNDSFTGFFRCEAALSTMGSGSVFGQNTMSANGVPIRRNAGNAATGWQTTLASDIHLGGLAGIEGLPVLGVLLPAKAVSDMSFGDTSDTIRRPVAFRDNDVNLDLFRFELSQSVRWGRNGYFQTRLRALYHLHDRSIRDHDARIFANIYGGLNRDLAGLLPDGYGSESSSSQRVRLISSVPARTDSKIAPGLPGGAHYSVFADLQPTDAYLFDYSIATRVDVQGEVLAQPAVRLAGLSLVSLKSSSESPDARG